MTTDPDSPIAPCLDTPEFRSTGGLTKREYFAAMAMQGLLANPQWVIKHDQAESMEEGYCFYEGIAQNALIHADTLIKGLNEDE